VGCAHSDFCGKVVREMAALREEMRAAHGKSDGDAGGGCAMCEREMHLTHHHLIPRCEHELMLKRGASKVHPRPLPTHTAMCKLRIGRLGDRNQPLNEAQRPHFRGVRVSLRTGYNRVRGIGRAWRNDGVSSSPTRVEFVRFAQ
jgi:hypothetical protein